MGSQRCDHCGFDGSRLTTADAVAALRSLGRRWREVFADGEPPDAARRPEAGEPSALDYAAHARDVVAALASHVERILSEHRPGTSGPPGVAAGTSAGDPDAVIGELERTASALASRAERVAMHSAWDRAGVLGDRDVTAGGVLREAVHLGTHHLRDARDALEAAS